MHSNLAGDPNNVCPLRERLRWSTLGSSIRGKRRSCSRGRSAKDGWDSDLKGCGCEMMWNESNKLKSREKGGKWWSSLQIPHASLPTDSLEQNWARTTCTGMLSLPFSRTHMIYTCPLLELDQRKFREFLSISYHWSVTNWSCRCFVSCRTPIAWILRRSPLCGKPVQLVMWAAWWPWCFAGLILSVDSTYIPTYIHIISNHITSHHIKSYHIISYHHTISY